jgi:putative nucleotidyltransferase with HDIG domain
LNRTEALELVEKSVSKKNLVKHMLATEVAMRALAERLDGDAEKWALAGLLHDIDYDETEKDFPRHGLLSAEMLSEIGVDPEIIDAIRAHPNHSEYPPKTVMDWALHAVDGLTGLIVAAALMHPDKKLAALDTAFVMRRFGEKRFAAGANRDQIRKCEKLGIPLEEFVEITLNAMQSISDDLGL